MFEAVRQGPLRALALAQNAAEVARFGGLQTGEEPAPYAVVSRRSRYQLRRYFADHGADGPAVLLVAPLMMSAEIWDVSHRVSAVRLLHSKGLDPWVIDFGRPEEQSGGLERSLSDHAVAVSDAIDEVRAATGRDVHLGGYSQGGMLCYQVAAYRQARGMASVITFGSPVDLRQMLPDSLSPEVLRRAGDAIGFVGSHVAVPGWATRNAFRMLDPVKAAQKQIDFLMALHDRDALLPREGQRRFIDDDGWVAFPGPALVEFAQQFLAQNRMLEGGIVVDGKTLTLADISCPVLAVIGDHDEVASARAIRPLRDAAPRADTWETHVGAGHLGLVVGSKAVEQAWPAVVEWTRWVDGEGPEPERSVRIADALLRDHPAQAVVESSATAMGADLVKHAAMGAAQTFVGVTRSVVGVGREVASQAPRLARLQQVGPDTVTSLALTLDEQAERQPQYVQFLYQQRAVTRAAAKHRIDAVVKGLIDIGVRRGDHVGVFMSARPSAVVAVAALNRIGAVAVLLRPGASIEREAALTSVRRVVADPERAEEAQRTELPVYVLGGGPDRPALPDGVTDLELVDPAAVTLPSWYRPNPGLARDVAFILFTGEGDSTRVNRITNRRWLLSAYGTATAASLTDRDTVYCLTPPWHPSGLLVAIGGAIAGGARFAMAEEFEPEVFWDEVRRYGVTVVTYTWQMLHRLVDAPPHPGENRHAIRLLVGSGMSPALAERARTRLAPARVVEFYTATDSEAVLVNLGASKPGSLGRPLPGSARVRIVEWDSGRDQPVVGADGFVRQCEVGQPGMLLAAVDSRDPSTGQVAALRGVFEPEDAWVVTGDLAWRDEQGDIWLKDVASRMIQTVDGARSPRAIRDRLEALENVDLAVAYGVRAKGKVLAVGAVTLRGEDTELTSELLDEVFAGVAAEETPDVVRVLDELPFNDWYRPVAGMLRDAGVDAGTSWRRGPHGFAPVHVKVAAK